MTEGVKLTPNLDQQTTKILNLTVLQRIDPCIEEILLTATHVTFYEFNIELNQWSRKDVEGSLFVVKRNGQPRFQFVVMNRRNTDNLVENLLGDFEYEVQVPYLLYRISPQEVNGIWFYNPRECEDVANLFRRILNIYSKIPPKSKVSAEKSEFEELEKVPTTAVIEGPLEPPSSCSTPADVLEESSYVNFFSSAINTGNVASNSTSSEQVYHTLLPAPLYSHVPSAVPSPAVSPQVLLSASTTPAPFYDTNESNSHRNQGTNLVKPSSFVAAPLSSSTLVIPESPMSSSLLTAALHAPPNLQRHYGTPVLRHFPPSAPSPSLTPVLTSAPSYGPAITRDKVRDAVLTLVQDNQFVEMVYEALLKAHNS